MELSQGTQFLNHWKQVAATESGFYFFTLLAFVFLFTVWMVYSRFLQSRKIKKLQKEIRKLEGQFSTIRDQRRSNLQIVREVVDGFEDIIQNMKNSLIEEEKKLEALDVSGNETKREKLTIEEK